MIDTESSGFAAFGCFSEAYCATLTTPVELLIATAKAAAPEELPMRPTTRLPSLNRKMLVPAVVSRPESTPAADTASENAIVPPSWSAPSELPVELTTGVASCAKPAGLRSVLTLVTPANSADTAASVLSSASAWTPAVSSCATVGAPCTIPAVGPSSWNCTASPMPVELVALSPSPSVTVTTASSAPSVIDTESSGFVAFGCFSEAYCATLTTPVELLIATAKAAAPAALPIRPTTRSPSLNRKMLVPFVVSRPESTPAADTASENAIVPPTESVPSELPVELTTALASCAYPIGLRSPLTLLTPANSATTPAAVVSSASPWIPAVSSCATVGAPCTIPAAGPSSSKWTCVPTTALVALALLKLKPPMSKVLLSLPAMPSLALMFSIRTRLCVPLVVHCTLSPVLRPVMIKLPSVSIEAAGVNCVLPDLTTKSVSENDVILTCASLVRPSTKFTPVSLAVSKAEILTVTGPTPGFVWLTVKEAVLALKTFWKSMLASTSASFWSRLGTRKFVFAPVTKVMYAPSPGLMALPLTPNEVVLPAWLILSTSLDEMFPPWD